jgi:hypothetical protein
MATAFSRALDVTCTSSSAPGLVEWYDRESVDKEWMTDRGACSRRGSDAEVYTSARGNHHCSGLFLKPTGLMFFVCVPKRATVFPVRPFAGPILFLDSFASKLAV